MGIFLSRISYSGVSSFYYLSSLLQLECRRLFRCNIARRNRPFPRSTNFDNSRITTSENASTQTCEQLRRKHSPFKRSEVGQLSRRHSTAVARSSSDFPLAGCVDKKPTSLEAYNTDVSEFSDDIVITMSSEEEKAEKKSKVSPARRASQVPSSRDEEGLGVHPTLTESRWTFPSVIIDHEQLHDSTTPLLHGVETGVNISFNKTNPPPLHHDESENSEAEHLQRSRSLCYENGNVDEYDDNVSSECTSSSDYNDICIFENPDFSQFGELYQKLASPSDKLLGSVEWRCRSLTSLSPVKEESESDQTSEAESWTRRCGLGETFLVCEETDGNRTHSCSSAERPRSYGKRLLCCSFSSDSGFGERSRESANTSTSEVSDASDFGDTSAHASDVSGASHECELRRFNEPTGRKDAFSRETSRNQGLLCGGSQTDVLDGEHCSREGSREDLKDQAARPLETAERRTLEPLNIKARRKVTFSENVPAGNSQSSSSSSPTPSSSSSSGSLNGGPRPAFSRQDSVESTSSVSSGESVLAVPLSPTSSASPTSSTAFPFPATGKHCFSEPCEGSDLVLIAEGERFHVHSSVVAWQCHVLHVHLRQTGSREVVLPNKSVDDVLSLLYVLYPFHRPTITDRNLEGLLDLAHTLGCERVMRMCSTYLMGLAQFRHLCPHRHLDGADHTQGHHSVDGAKGQNDVYNAKGHHHVNHVKGRHPSDSSSGVHSSSSEDGASVTSPDELFARMRNRDTQTVTSLCACADSMAERAMDILQLAVRYDMDEVYHTYLDVAARVRSDDLRACPRYGHLSAAMREDMLTSRVTRLEKIVSSVSVRKSDLIGCGRSRHESYRLTFNGELCLRCVSRNLLREAKDSA